MKANVTDLIGNTYGGLTVISFDQVKKLKKSYWLCKCKCGNISSVYRGSLLSGNTKSCGCLHREVISKAKKTHYEATVRTKEYRAWAHMKGRCYDKNDGKYKDYGFRGIMVCDRWISSYENFLLDMGRAPSKTHSIDRINMNGNYEPNNCRWATPTQQARNTTRNHFITYNGKSLSVSEWVEITKISSATIIARVNLGWPVEEILFKPVDRTSGRFPKGSK